jgi:hypothetical protein
MISLRAAGLLRQPMLLALPVEEDHMLVWSKRLVAILLALFVLMLGIFLLDGSPDSPSVLKLHTTRWMALNYLGLIVWVFIWMIDQARMRGKNLWIWLIPFALAPLPTLMFFILFLQRRIQPS